MVKLFECLAWIATSLMSDKRRFSAESLSASNQLFVSGGEVGKVRLSSVESFDQNLGWKSEQPMPVTVSRHCSVPFDSGLNVREEIKDFN
jgi:hypothetical protein